MASFALVRLKSSGTVMVVPVHDIRRAGKENGVRCYTPFEPAHENDFIVSRKHKYVVHLTDADGTVRQWHAMIGRLGASARDVRRSAASVPVSWPEVRRTDQSVPALCPNSVSDVALNGEEMDVDNVEKEDRRSQGLSAPAKQEGASTQSNQITSTKIETRILEALIEASNIIQQQKSLHSAREKEVCGLVEDIAASFEQRSNDLEKRLSILEHKLEGIEKVVCKGANVLEWLRNSPSELEHSQYSECPKEKSD
ncbi:hypothetical protein ONE63_009183 [Megalurothrips usitatus]|uniref:Uncharacterized protein n=1 Tax=Megalurothrips usitatus TaxID=439358 RepID=A0AAV7XM82_9NEOP|nr:hypothetical protein ONE63_009183 [Megalurothrips usitatus]